MSEYTFECCVKFKIDLHDKDVETLEKEFGSLYNYAHSDSFEQFMLNYWNEYRMSFEVCDFWSEEEL